MTYRNILVPIEHLKYDHIILKAAFDIANLFKATVTVLHLNKAHSSKGRKTLLGNKNINTPQNNTRQVDVRVTYVQPEKISNAIVEESKLHDLTIIGPNRMSLIKEFLSKNTPCKENHLIAQFLMIPTKP